MPPKLTPLQTEMIAQLRAETGAARDACYIVQQKAAHGGALNVQKAYAMEGGLLSLRRAAQDIVPVVEQHIATLMKM
jgi:putative membrane protein